MIFLFQFYHSLHQ